MAEYNYTCGDCLHVQICEGDPSLRAFDRKKTAYCKAFKNAADVAEVDKAMEFIESYSFKDDKKVYTNGSVLVPLFRVKQALIDKAYNGLFEG